ncbi:unnamed protein product [Clonostachys rhizophaga]|uniref:Pyruvate decarboxylase n=1 Tax=Clonostachys rhizophaga TaxID=160324 RepID=A0A9N9V0G7_9HYPO|nr:unnamed protein product [Clonostachys rhizophaga]
MTDTIDLAEYLWLRLKQLGVNTVHGVPGDYNLCALDYIEPLGLHWAGNSNELNAGYAVDAYARVKGIGALITTSGVGELSAINAIAGAYAERSPVVHITGTPPTTAQSSGAFLHHTMGDGDFRRFAKMAQHVVVAQANLCNRDTAPDDVDRVLRMCKLHSRPVYIELPTDMVKTQVPGSRLENAIDLTVPRSPNDQALEAAAAVILDRLYAARQPFLLLDGLLTRYNSREEAGELTRALGIPTCSTAFGKSVLVDRPPNYYGVYAGTTGDQSLHSWVQHCDLVLALGPLFCDSNTFGFTTKPDPALTIAIHKDHVEFGSQDEIKTILNVPMKQLLQAMLGRLDPAKLKSQTTDSTSPLLSSVTKSSPMVSPDASGALHHQELWKFISPHLAEGDIVLADTGTSSIGSSALRLPARCSYITSPLWLSIGFALPAAAGASAAEHDIATAAKRPAGRTILFEGDGSFQMTVQSVSDMIRARLNVIIFVLNNNGYTVERWIHGMEAEYNNIAPWQYLRTADYFGAPQDEESYPVIARRASTWKELTAVLRDPVIIKGQGLAIVELILGESDAPVALQEMAAAAAQKFCS